MIEGIKYLWEKAKYPSLVMTVAVLPVLGLSLVENNLTGFVGNLAMTLYALTALHYKLKYHEAIEALAEFKTSLEQDAEE